MSQSGKTPTVKLVLQGLLAIGVLVAGFMVFGYLASTRPEPKKAERDNKGQLVEVQPAHTSTQQIAVIANGQVIPSQQIALSAEVAGRVVWLSDELIPGGRFSASAKVARIDARDYTLALEQQIAAVDNANTALAIEQSQKQIAEREWKLMGKGKPDSALALREPQMRTAQAAVKAARSGLQRARLSVGKTVIRSPFNAVVQRKNVDIGQLVGPQTPLATLVGTDSYWVQVSLPIDRLSWIDIPGVRGADTGSSATITQSIGEDRIVRTGQVIRLLGDLDPVGRMARVLVEIDDPLGLDADANAANSARGGLPLLLGSYVTVEIAGRERDNVIELPRSAIHGGDLVYIMDGDSKLDIRKVGVLWRKRDSVLIGSGLSAGDNVVVTPIGTPVAGMKLRTEAPSAADAAAGDGTPDRDANAPDSARSADTAPDQPPTTGAAPRDDAAGAGHTLAKPSR